MPPNFDVNENWKPATTESELEEFLESSMWKDIQAVIHMQCAAFAQEVLDEDTGVDTVYVLRGRNSFAQLMLNFPKQIKGMLLMEKHNKKITKEY